MREELIKILKDNPFCSKEAGEPILYAVDEDLLKRLEEYIENKEEKAFKGGFNARNAYSSYNIDSNHKTFLEDFKDYKDGKNTV